MDTNTVASMIGVSRPDAMPQGAEGVVEIGLLLPTKRAAALLRLAQDRRESVGQVLRKLIERELAETF
jgi:hypothetical protein